MSGPVDVLAVMDDRVQQGLARADHRRGKAEPLGVIELRQARAAVAELIEACEGVETLYAELGKALPALAGTPSYDVVQDAVRKARTALARCRGEA